MKTLSFLVGESWTFSVGKLGDKGENGTKGQKGEPGSDGAAGAQGRQGGKGQKGASGLSLNDVATKGEPGKEVIFEGKTCLIMMNNTGNISVFIFISIVTYYYHMMIMK